MNTNFKLITIADRHYSWRLGRFVEEESALGNKLTVVEPVPGEPSLFVAHFRAAFGKSGRVTDAYVCHPGSLLFKARARALHEAFGAQFREALESACVKLGDEWAANTLHTWPRAPRGDGKGAELAACSLHVLASWVLAIREMAETPAVRPWILDKRRATERAYVRSDGAAVVATIEPFRVTEATEAEFVTGLDTIHESEAKLFAGAREVNATDFACTFGSKVSRWADELVYWAFSEESDYVDSRQNGWELRFGDVNHSKYSFFGE